MNTDKLHFLEHPEVTVLLNESFPELVNESDRGAVIIGADIVDSVLHDFFDDLMSSEVSNKNRKRLFDYTGPLGTFSSKNDMALAVGYINKKTHDCINALRKVRNSAAHSNKKFSFESEQQSVREIYNLGDGVPVAVNNWAVNVLMERFVNFLLKSKGIDDKPIFSDFEECIDYLSDNPSSTSKVNEKLPAYRFSLGLVLLCAYIVQQKERRIAERNH